MPIRKGFTLIEMLLVVAVISLLISILMPTLSRVRGAGDEVNCKTKLRQIGEAFQRFAIDHGQNLPAASWGGWEGASPWQKCWIGREGRVPGAFEPPNDGPLVPYLGGGGEGTKAFYRCPSLQVSPRHGGGSNGGFDYTMMLSFSGARVRAVPQHARVVYMSDPFGPVQENLRTPLIVEENPAYHANSISIEPGFGSIDRMANHHTSGNSNYAAIDGGVETYVVLASRPPQAWEWFVTPRGSVERRLNASVVYDYWGQQ